MPGGTLTGQQSTEPARAQHDSPEQRSSAERQRRAAAADSRTGTHGRSDARQPPATVREVAARQRAEDGGGRSRRGAESSALSSGSGGPRLTETLLAELEAQHKLQARKEKLVDVHGEAYPPSESAPVLSRYSVYCLQCFRQSCMAHMPIFQMFF